MRFLYFLTFPVDWHPELKGLPVVEKVLHDPVQDLVVLLRDLVET